jgi:hypothetical protein
VFMCILLYFTWYKHLPPPAPEAPEEETATTSTVASAAD